MHFECRGACVAPHDPFLHGWGVAGPDGCANSSVASSPLYALVLCAQYFAPPVPSCPPGASDLLDAIRTWVDEEAAAVRATAPADLALAADAYATALVAWKAGIGRAPAAPVPRLTAALTRAASAVSAAACDRLRLAVTLYRREHRSASLVATPSFPPGSLPLAGPDHAGASRSLSAEFAAVSGTLGRSKARGRRNVADTSPLVTEALVDICEV